MVFLALICFSKGSTTSRHDRKYERKRGATACLLELKHAGVYGLDNVKTPDNEKDKFTELNKTWRNFIESGSKEPKQSGHVMMSYCQKRQKVVHKLWKKLESEGIPIWIDVANLGAGDLGETLSEAIDGARIFVSCFSEEYQKSPYCRKEFAYAQSNKKHLIPVKVQPGYTAQSWLAFQLGDQLYFDISKAETFDAEADKLIKEIHKILGDDQKKRKEPILSEVKEKGESSTHGQAVTASPPKGHSYREWNGEQVSIWLKENQMEDLLKR